MALTLRGRAFVLVFAAGVGSAGTVALAGSPPRAEASEEAKVELGRRLFFDPAASRLGIHACADCHVPEHGFSDPSPKSHDDFGLTPRHSQTVIDVGASPSAHWDGEFASVEELVLTRLGDRRSRKYYGPAPSASASGTNGEPALTPREVESLMRLATDARGGGPGHVLAGGRRYAEAFQAAFGDGDVDDGRIADALAAFCHSVQSGESPYDRYARGDAYAISDAARRGLLLFQGAAGCAACHRMDGPRAAFTDYAFHNTGLEWRETDRHGGTLRGDVGRQAVDRRREGLRAFKTPTLRDVAGRGPYFHDGSAPTLEDAVRHYLSGQIRDDAIDPQMPAFVARADDVADLVAFLRSLTSDRRPGRSVVPWSLRPASTRLRVLDADGRGLSGRAVTLLPVGDFVPGGGFRGALVLVTDAKGWVEYPAPPATHVRVAIDGEVPALGGDRVPDTCARAEVRWPVRGTVSVRVAFPAGVLPPQSVVAEPVGTARVLAGALGRTLLRLAGEPTVDGGRAVAVYRGDARTDLPAEARLSVPVGAFRATVPVTLESGTVTTVDLTR